MNVILSPYPAEYGGARWLRTDLHLHTPGAFSFKLPNGLDPVTDRDAIIERYVQQLVDQQIEVAAITDYQGVRIDWFAPIQQRAAERGIVIYPGAEISFNFPKYGLHVLAIFPLETDLAAINRCIHGMDVNPAHELIGPNGEHQDISAKGRVQDELLHLRQSTKCILILAHPNDSSGIFKSCSLKDAAEFIRDISPDGIENFEQKDRKRLTDNGGFSTREIDRIACVESSDPKSIEEIGTKYRPNGDLRSTYLKLSAPGDLRAVSLALHDPTILTATGNRPRVDYSHFVNLSVDGAGFLGGLNIALSPELNVLVGGRGVGKSAILETLRYVLDLAPFSPTGYRDALVQHALGSGGKASLLVEQVVNIDVRRRYRFERVWGQEPLVYEMDPERSVPLPPTQILADHERPIFFGQREIYEITSNEKQRLRLLDEIVGRQAQKQIQEIEKLVTRLRHNGRRILELRIRLLERDDIEQRLKEIRHQIELYRRHGIVEKLRAATTLAADEQRLNQVDEGLSAARQEWLDQRNYWSDRWSRLIRQINEAESSQKALLAPVSRSLLQLRADFEGLFGQGDQLISTASEQLASTRRDWNEARKPLDEEIRIAKQEMGASSLDPDELIRLTAEETRLVPRLQILDDIQRELDDLVRVRTDNLNLLREARRQVWLTRNEQARGITQDLHDRVRVEVIFGGQKAEFADVLASFFRGSGVDRRSVERIAASDGRVDGIALAHRARQGVEAMESAYGISTARAQQIVGFLAEDEDRMFQLQLLAPDDTVRVELRINDTFQALERLSAGQRATAMLLLLLAQKDRLLLVDQPEDDLDNRFIYDDVVRILRDQKGKRQLLAATHNPNIPVLGHAELIVALEANDAKATISTQGAIDNSAVQQFVRDVMEGGEDAFQRRAQKYGWV